MMIGGADDGEDGGEIVSKMQVSVVVMRLWSVW